MNGFYQLMLVLIIFGAVSGFVNEFTVFGQPVPVGGATLDESAVTDFGEGAVNQVGDGTGMFASTLNFGRILLSIVTAMFGVGLIIKDYMIALGADSLIAWGIGAVVQAPVSFITFTGFYEILFNRSVT